MSQARIPWLFAAAAISFSVSVVPLTPANGSDTVCPDYAEYRGVLIEGERQLGDYQSQFVKGSAKPDRSYPEVGLNPQGLTALQHAIVCAEFEEQQGDLTEALKWWSGVLPMMAQSKYVAAQEPDNVARIHSRLGDIYVALSRPEISESAIRNYDWKKEIWTLMRFRLRSQNPFRTIVVPVSELTHARVEKILQMMSAEATGASLRPDARKYLQLALTHYQTALEDRKSREGAIHYSVLDSIKCAAIQHRLGNLEDERNNMRTALAAFLNDKFQGYTKDPSEILRPQNSSEWQSTSSPAKEYVAVRGLGARSSQSNKNRNERTGETKAAVKSPESGGLPPIHWGRSVSCHRSNPLWAVDENLFVESAPMAAMFSSRLLTCALKDGTDIAAAAATHIDPLELVDRAVKFPIPHGQKSGTRIVEEKLSALFGDALWVPSAMVTYAKFNRPQDVKRLYHSKSWSLLPLSENRKDEQIKVGEALAAIGAKAELERYCEQWRAKLPRDPVARAYSRIALATFDQSAQGVSQMISACEHAVTELRQDKLNDEDATNSKIEIANLVISSLNKLPATQSSKSAIGNAQSLLGSCNHRLMQLECLTLGRQLHITGARLERAGQFQSAAKTYLAAADIYLKNLGEKDVDTGIYLIDCARALMLAGDVDQAGAKIELAMRVIRAAPNRDNDALKMGLQTFADIVNIAGDSQKAESIYAELRRLP